MTASFIAPALGNLDTAFQGMNVWHSLQYLALTWMLNRLRFDRAYYIAVLSVLWIHYFHDHYLFTKPGVIRV